jgi:hypothetical protein
MSIHSESCGMRGLRGRRKAPLRTPGVSVDANGGNYQTLTSDALLEFVHERSALDAVRQALGEELAP